MLTPTEIAAGAGRLTANKLKPEDVESLASVFEMTFAGISDATHDYRTDLAALNDGTNTAKKAASVAGALIKLEGLGFTGATLSGGRGALTYSEKEEYTRLVLFAFSKLYPIPKEFSIFELRRSDFLASRRASQTVMSTRVE